MNEKTLIVIADYGIGDPAFTEVLLQLRMRLPDVFIHPQSALPFSTIHTGFWTYQIALTPGIKNTYIFSNTAPRKETKEAVKNNGGEKLMYARLSNGFEIIGVNAGFVFSFVKEYIDDFRYVDVANEGSQFRSRDFYPEAVARIVQADRSVLGKQAEKAIIPLYPRDVIASIDGYGNIKLTTRQSRAPYHEGQKLEIAVNGLKHEAMFTDGMFNSKEGQLAIVPGSSGYDNRFLEVFVRGGSAHALFGSPQPETPVRIVALEE